MIDLLRPLQLKYHILQDRIRPIQNIVNQIPEEEMEPDEKDGPEVSLLKAKRDQVTFSYFINFDDLLEGQTRPVMIDLDFGMTSEQGEAIIGVHKDLISDKWVFKADIHCDLPSDQPAPYGYKMAREFATQIPEAEKAAAQQEDVSITPERGLEILDLLVKRFLEEEPG